MAVRQANGRCGLRSTPNRTLDPSLHTTRHGATLTVEGELDLGAAGTLAALLADTTITTVDLANVTFVDSYGLRVLLQAHRARLGRQGAPPLQLRAPSPPIERLIALSGLTGHLPVTSA